MDRRIEEVLQGSYELAADNDFLLMDSGRHLSSFEKLARMVVYNVVSTDQICSLGAMYMTQTKIVSN